MNQQERNEALRNAALMLRHWEQDEVDGVMLVLHDTGVANDTAAVHLIYGLLTVSLHMSATMARAGTTKALPDYLEKMVGGYALRDVTGGPWR